MDSPPAELNTDNDVYRGVWTNWSDGRIRGVTLTLSRRNGGLFTAFLALFVTVVGTCFWRIGCFFIHRHFSSQHSRDALCHQQQAILRNAANSTSGLWILLKACWAWRRNGLAPYRRLLPSLFFAVLTSMVFAVATIFSSEVTITKGHEALLRGSNCGSLTIADASEAKTFFEILPYVSQRMVLSMAYAQRCYNNNTNSRDCSVIYKPRLHWTGDRNATCPFPGGEDICLTSSSNLRLDSGYIESDRDLGINSPPGTKFLYRSLVDCAPVKTKGYTKKTVYVPSEEALAKTYVNQTVFQYFYGELPNYDKNFTYEYAADPLYGPRFHYGIKASASSDYTLEVMGSYSDINGRPQKEASDFYPISALQANASDVTLLFLSTNGVQFATQCDDPWYAAHNSKFTESVSGDNTWREFPHGDEPVRVLGCTQQYQICNPDPKMGHSCTPLTGARTVIAAADTLWRTNKQKELFHKLADPILTDAGHIYGTVAATGVSSLIARHGLVGGLQGRLPSNQWQLEVENWYGAALADIQRSTVELVIGPTDPDMFKYIKRPQTEEEHFACRSLKIRSDAVTSFSILSLGVLLGFGGLIIIVSTVIAPLAGWVDKWSGRGEYTRLEWTFSDTLQFQRLAHEELGCGTWTGEGVPITVLGEKLAVLDVSDPSHSRLVNPAAISKDDAAEANAADSAKNTNETTNAFSPSSSNTTIAVDV